MIIDKNGKILGKISIVDIFIMIMIISIFSFSVLKIGNKNSISINKRPECVYMKFYAEEVQNFVAYNLKIGDNVYQEENNITLGKIVDLNIKDSIKFKSNKDGILTKSNKQNYSCLEITTKLNAHRNNKTILISGNSYYIGRDIVIRAGNTKIYLKISDIDFRK